MNIKGGKSAALSAPFRLGNVVMIERIKLFLLYDLYVCLFLLSSATVCLPEELISSATLSLTVRDSIMTALENNRSLAVERYGPEIAETFVGEEEAIFDPALNADFTASKSSGQRTSGVGEFRTVKNQAVTGAAGVSKLFPSGVSLDVETSARRQDSDVYATLFSSRLGASLTVPVLKGFGADVNLVGIRLAEKDIDLSRSELRGFVLALAAQVEETYWDLRLAREELKIHLASLDLARKQMQETKDRIDVGELPEIELAAAEGEVALREEDVIDARSNIEKTTFRYLHALNPPSENIWSQKVELLDSFKREEYDLGSVEDRIALARRRRPDLEQARIEFEMSDMQLVRTKNGLLPKLDFFLTLGKTGYSNAYLDTFSNLKEDSFDASGGFTFTYTLGNRAAKARRNRTLFRKKEAQAALLNFEQMVDLDVRIAYSELNRATLQISASQKATQLQEAKYQAEVEKFKVGKSTNLLVLAAQRDLTESRLDEIDALVKYRKAILGLHQADGTLMDKYEIVVPSVSMD